MKSVDFDMSDIVSAIDEEEADIGKAVALASGKIGLEILRRVVIPHPVDTGRSRAAWLMSRGEPSGSALPPGDYDKAEGEQAAASAISRAAAVAGSIQGFEQVYVENNVEYVSYLNESHPVAAGFIDVAVETVKSSL